MQPEFDLSEIPVEFLPFFEPEGMTAGDAWMLGGVGSGEALRLSHIEIHPPIRKTH